MHSSSKKLLDQFANGDRRALAKLITLIDNRHEDVLEVLSIVRDRSGRAVKIGITGPPGSGKSTLMHILGFLDRPTSGSYIFKGQAMANFDDDKLASIRNAEVGFVFQSYFLLAKTTVWENVKLPLIYNNCSDKDQRVASALKEVGL